MEPLAIAGYMMIAGAVVSAALAGALGGAVAWGFRIHFLWGAALAVAVHAGVAHFDVQVSLAGAAVFGALPLTVSLAAAWLAARQLETRAKWHHAAATLAGLVLGTVAGLVAMHPFVPRP